MKETLCWICENATGGCSWSNHWEHSPVPGWTAVKTNIRNNNSGDGSSYIVIDCPEFVREQRRYPDVWAEAAVKR